MTVIPGILSLAFRGFLVNREQKVLLYWNHNLGQKASRLLYNYIGISIKVVDDILPRGDCRVDAENLKLGVRLQIEECEDQQKCDSIDFTSRKSIILKHKPTGYQEM